MVPTIYLDILLSHTLITHVNIHLASQTSTMFQTHLIWQYHSHKCLKLQTYFLILTLNIWTLLFLFTAPGLGHVTYTAVVIYSWISQPALIHPIHCPNMKTVYLWKQTKPKNKNRNKTRNFQSFFVSHKFEFLNLETKGIQNAPYLRIIIYSYSTWDLFFFYPRTSSNFSFQLNLITQYTYPQSRISCCL